MSHLQVLQASDGNTEGHRLSTVGTGLWVEGALVLPRHVAERNRELFLRIEDDGDDQRFRLSTRQDGDSPGFAGHPNSRIDLACLQPKLGNKLPCQLPIPALAEEPPALGSECLVVGFHPDVLPEGKPRPVVRRAVVALSTDGGYADGAGFLLDCEVAPGMSGSVVVRHTESSVLVIGILEGYLPSRRALIDSRSGRAKYLVEESSGLALAMTSGAVCELLRAVKSQQAAE